MLGGWDWVLLLSVATSALASTQTTIIPASRTGLSMARRAALPHRLAHIHPRFRTPDVSTWTVAGDRHRPGTSLINLISENALFDSLTALSLLIAFYYSLTGIACAVYYRRQLLRSASNLLLIGVGPVDRLGPADLAADPLGRRPERPGGARPAESPGSASARRW